MGKIYSNPNVNPNVVGTGQIVDDSITSADIAADAVGASELANNAVDTAAIQTDAVAAAAIATDAVGAAEIAAGAVGTSEVAADSLLAADLATDSVDSAEIGASAVGSSELASAAVIAGKIATGGVSAAGQFAAGVVDSAALGSAAVTAGKIATGGVSAAGQFAAGVVDAAAIATDGVDSAEIAANAVTASELAAGSLTAADAAADMATQAELDAVIAGAVTDGSITGAKLATGVRADPIRIVQCQTYLPGGNGGGSWYMPVTGLFNQGTLFALFADLYSADHAVAGKTCKLRLVANFICNGTAPTGNWGAQLSRVTAMAGASATLLTPTCAAAALSTATVNAPAANSMNRAATAWTTFDSTNFPDGVYLFTLSATAVLPANAVVGVSMFIEKQYV